MGVALHTLHALSGGEAQVAIYYSPIMAQTAGTG